MKLDIGEAIENGFNRTLTRSAAYLAGIFFIINLVSRAMSDTILDKLIESGTLNPQFQEVLGSQVANVAPLATGLSMNAASAIALVTGLVSVVVTIGGIRLFLSDEKETLKTELFTENIGWVFLNVVVGALAFSAVLTAGFVAFIIPGFFLLAALYFWNFRVIDENANFIEGLKFSWNATRNNRLRSFALIFVTTIAAGIFSAATGSILGLIGGLAGSAVAAALGLLPTSLATVFTLATFTSAYKQFKDRTEKEREDQNDSEDEEKEESEDDEDSSTEESEEEEE